MNRNQGNRGSVLAESSSSSRLNNRTMEPLLPTPNITRTRQGLNFNRRMRSRFLVCSGFVLLTMIFSYLLFSPSTRLYLNDNHGQGFNAELSASSQTGEIHRKLLQDEIGSGQPPPTVKNET